MAKAKCDAALLREGQLTQRTFALDPAGFAAVDRWIGEQGVEAVHACLEATGAYGAALALARAAAGQQVSIVTPARIAASAQSRWTRTKTDTSAAARSAHFGAREQPPIWTPPSAEVQEVQALGRRVEMRQEMVQHEEHRRQGGGSAQAVRASIAATRAFPRQELAQTQHLVQQQGRTVRRAAPSPAAALLDSRSGGVDGGTGARRDCARARGRRGPAVSGLCRSDAPGADVGELGASPATAGQNGQEPAAPRALPPGHGGHAPPSRRAGSGRASAGPRQTPQGHGRGGHAQAPACDLWRTQIG